MRWIGRNTINGKLMIFTTRGPAINAAWVVATFRNLEFVGVL